MAASRDTSATKSRMGKAKGVANRPSHRRIHSAASDDPLWYKDAVIYELHVRSFFDSDGDGVGDFAGLTSRLDYLQQLGVTALWLLPFYPSPLRDDGYDIADYWDVNPSYGTLDDFREFLSQAHRRDLKVITELVINHTSDQHVWFQRARRAPAGSPERKFYVWSDDPEKYRETRIIFKDFEPSNWTWDPVAEQYYWHRFYHHQPDLNFDNPEVRKQLFQVLDYWLGMGVDGLRLDAIPYLYEREGTNCENLRETHVFLKALRAHVDASFKNRMLLAEANQWPEDAAEYFGDGDECHMNFHFPIMPRLFMALRMEDRFPIADILEQTPAIPDTAQWALFLRNHDELTLEMVTDEERDYMYRVYAHEHKARINLGIRRRLAPLLENSRSKIELMNALLLALPGTPVLYYGDEIGMGDNFYLGDRHGVRTPMQWSGDRNAGFSRANPQQLFLPVVIDPEYHYESLNVEAQHQNTSSLLWWTRRIIQLRRQHPAFGRGTFQWVDHANKKVLAFLREYGNETILVVANLSRFCQAVALDLSAHHGRQPVELFGRTRFPVVTDEPYPITLGPHTFYWFALTAGGSTETGEHDGKPIREALPRLRPVERWEDAVRDSLRSGLDDALLPFLRRQRWFGGKGREVRGVEIEDTVPVPTLADRAKHKAHTDGVVVLVCRVEYLDAEEQRYLIPLRWMASADAERHLDVRPATAVARLPVGAAGEGLLVDAAAAPGFGRHLLALVREGKRIQGDRGFLEGKLDLRDAFEELDGALDVRLGGAEQSNTSVVFGTRWILKLLRRVEDGENLDREIGLFLGEHGFTHTAQVAGAITYRRRRLGPENPGSITATAAVLQGFVPNEGDAWEWMLDTLGRFYEKARASERTLASVARPTELPVRSAEARLPDSIHEVLDLPFVETIHLLGQRTGEMHAALASGIDPEFAPEPFGTLYQRSLYQSMRNLVGQTQRALEPHVQALDYETAEKARTLLGRRSDLIDRFRSLVKIKLSGHRIRVHGDYHLGQVLWTGRDFVIIDFEGEPARPLSERRLKRSPLRDVAGMLRSFHYASLLELERLREQGTSRTELLPLAGWATLWNAWTSRAFLRGYLEVVGDTGILPSTTDDRQLLLDIFLLEKALYELGYELSNRPEWVSVPLEGILALLDGNGYAPEA